MLGILALDFWVSRDIWLESGKNTSWCLLGCSIGDLGTIYLFQVFNWGWKPISIMALAMINGLITSILLETFVLVTKKIRFKIALSTALGMSFLSMLAMELAMNVTDFYLAGGSATLKLSFLPLILLAGFITPWPYNYWRLKELNESCH
tara:strand:+ start:518 stop:964 length:447 start_codon:yes stop_codon:yes gene_type:complete